jgi:phenylacetate-CoA ligase
MLKRYLSYFQTPDPERVERRIIKLIKCAYEHVPFYHDLMKAHGLTPNAFNNLEDYLKKFPRTPTNEYRKIHQEKGINYMMDDRVQPETLIEIRSSGSSGIPLSIYKTKKEKINDNAKTIWHLTHGGLRPWHRVLAVVDPANVVKRDSIFQEFGIFRRYFGHSMMDPEHIMHIIDEKKINAIYGQKSMIVLMAKQYDKTGRKPPHLSFLMPGAERISRADREILCRIFVPRHYGEYYGSSETGIIATKVDGDYKVNFHSTFFCLTDPETLGNLTQGTITVTSQDLEAQPILMVGLGDIVTVRNFEGLLELNTSIVSIDGRDNDYLVLENGEKLTGMVFLAVLDNPLFILQFRIIQDCIGSCRILLRLREETEANKREVEHLLESVLGGKIRYEIEYVDDIPIDPNEKTKVLVSKIAN